jgi:hypothetical protein
VLTPTSAPGAKQQAQATRARYDALFSANVRAHAPKPPSPPTPTPAKRQNAGWRGLSIDVPPTPAPPPGPAPITEPGPEARLDGRLVREIWLKSRLGPQRLRGIWCVSLPLTVISAVLKHCTSLFCFVGMSATRMGRARLIATRLRAGWRGLMSTCVGHRCSVALVLARARVRAHRGRFLLVRFYAEL